MPHEPDATGIAASLVGLDLPLSDATLALLQRMLACVVDNLRLAEARIRSPEGLAKHRRKRGWFTVRSRPRRPHEESVSSALAKEFEALRRSSFRSCLEAFNLTVACEVGRDEEGGIGPASKPTDLRIYNWGRGDEALDLRIEAKVVRLATDVGAYAGADGVGRFLDEEEPYTTGVVGGMAAYALLDRPEDWHARIGASLTGFPCIRATHLVRLGSGGSPVLVSVVAPPPGSRLALRLLLHLVLEFDLDPCGRTAVAAPGPPRRARAQRRDRDPAAG